jgi:hypothetical protein
MFQLWLTDRGYRVDPQSYGGDVLRRLPIKYRTKAIAQRAARKLRRKTSEYTINVIRLD